MLKPLAYLPFLLGIFCLPQESCSVPWKNTFYFRGTKGRFRWMKGRFRWMKGGKPLSANCGHLGPPPRAGAALRVTLMAAPRELRCGECARGSARGGWRPPPPSASETPWGCGGEQEAAGRSRGHLAFPFPQAGGGTGKTRLCQRRLHTPRLAETAGEARGSCLKSHFALRL